MKNWIGITLGDVTGIGPEVALKAIAAELPLDDTRYLLIGDAGYARRLNEKRGLNLGIQSFDGEPGAGRGAPAPAAARRKAALH